MRFSTSFDYPPIPIRDYDYSAIDADTYDGAPDAGARASRIGRGRTAAAAIADLAEQWDELTADDLCRALAELSERPTPQSEYDATLAFITVAARLLTLGC